MGADSQPPAVHDVTAQLQRAQAKMASASAEVARLRSQPFPSTPIAQLRAEALMEHADYAFRAAVRDEQEAIYHLAAEPTLESAVLGNLRADQTAGMADVAEGLRALWHLAGYDDFSQVRVRHNRRFRDSEPLANLVAYYREAGAHYGIDWSYLAAINFIESDFGRNNGPSSAGALGPMQFLPSTWRVYGSGDIMNPHDSIFAAARYLSRLGAPANYDRAILGYNRSNDYLSAVKHFAAALRSDERWLQRLYYWSTYG